MNNDWFSRPLVHKATELLSAAEQHAAIPEVQTLAIRLDKAIGLMDSADLERPATIALFGGTHVGKSALFNALIGRPNASPVSEGRGCFTQDPVAAVHPADAGRLPWLDALGTTRISGPLQDVALVDTADIDGVEGERQDKTRTVMDKADVLVFVSSPDKRSNFDVLNEMKSRVSRKRWFFVLTRADQVSPDVFDDFCRGIRELGFDTGPHCCFFVNGMDPDGYDLPRLRSQIFSSRPAMQLRALHEETFLGELSHALDPATTERFKALSNSLGQSEAELNTRVAGLFDEVLSSAEAQKRLRFLTQHAVWREAVGRTWLPLKFYIFLRARFASLPLFWTLGRMASLGPNLLRIATAGFQALWSRNRVAIPLELLGRCFTPKHLEQLEHIKHQARRAIEDLDLDELIPEEEAPDETQGGQALAKIPLFGQSLQAWQEAQRERKRSSKAQVLEALQESIDDAAIDMADRAVRWRHNFFGNLLPCLLLAHGVFRLFASWMHGHFLHFNFFFHLLLLLLFALLPGYWLISASVRRVTKSTAVRPVQQLTEPAETADLRTIASGLDHFSDKIDRLERRAQQTRETISKELAPETFGARLR